jgi:hypothetical protein
VIPGRIRLSNFISNTDVVFLACGTGLSLGTSSWVTSVSRNDRGQKTLKTDMIPKNAPSIAWVLCRRLEGGYSEECVTGGGTRSFASRSYIYIKILYQIWSSQWLTSFMVDPERKSEFVVDTLQMN